VLEKMRFFKWPQDDSLIEIRALAYDPEVKLREQADIKAKNVFCRVLPADMTHSSLFEKLSNYADKGDIKSVKVAYDPDSNKSRKYGYVSFASEEIAKKVLEKAE
jgi:RNA recognition motif-containing protein